MIPNAASVVHQGHNPVVFSASVNENRKKSLLSLFEIWGRTPEVDENKLEAFAIITAMGPTNFWFQWLEMKRFGERLEMSEYELQSAL